MFLRNIKYNQPLQFFTSSIIILLVTLVCKLLDNYFDYQIVALILFLIVSLLAVFFEILPVLFSAILSGLILNFYFIPPFFTFHIDSAENVLLFFIYVIIALLNAVFTVKFRDYEKKNRNQEEKENTIKLYNTLFNSLSHELRTPIATIIGAMDTIKENEPHLSPTNKKELYFEIENAAQRLNRQVGNLLNMSRLESGMLTLKYDWCDIYDLIHTAIQKCDFESKNQQVIFQQDALFPLFKLDSGLIEQAIQNVLHNAIQYTPVNSQITIRVTTQNNLLQIEISDNGTGIDEKEIPEIFDKFYRSKKAKTGGTGLGLSIVKGYIEAHKGNVKIKNNTPNGLIVSIEIPVEMSYIGYLKNE